MLTGVRLGQLGGGRVTVCLPGLNAGPRMLAAALLLAHCLLTGLQGEAGEVPKRAPEPRAALLLQNVPLVLG